MTPIEKVLREHFPCEVFSNIREAAQDILALIPQNGSEDTLGIDGSRMLSYDPAQQEAYCCGRNDTLAEVHREMGGE